jgi:glutaredoxin
MQVTLLTQESCSYCDQAKGLLERLTPEFRLSVTEVPLDSPDGTELAVRLGVMFAPGIVVDGKLLSYGRPSERRLRRDLRKRTTQSERGAPS